MKTVSQSQKSSLSVNKLPKCSTGDVVDLLYPASDPISFLSHKINGYNPDYFPFKLNMPSFVHRASSPAVSDRALYIHLNQVWGFWFGFFLPVFVNCISYLLLLKFDLIFDSKS